MRNILTGFLLLFLGPVLAQQTIKGKFLPPEEFDWVLVYKVSPTHSNYVGDAKVNEKGEFEFEMDSTQTRGMYRLVYAVPQEEYNFDIIYNAKEDVEFVFNINTGLDYQESAENKMMTSYTKSMAIISQSLGKFFREQSKDTTALLSIFKTQRDTQKEYETISEGTIASNFIKANRPYVPDSFEDLDTYVTNLKKHYFEYVDFNNEILQSSNFLVERCINYVFGMLSGSENEVETYKNNVTDVAKAMTDATPETRKMLLHILWTQFTEANFEEVANFITDSYLLELAETLNEGELAQDLIRYKNVSFGATAPDFKIELTEDGKPVDKSLHDLDIAQQYVLVFWSSSCSHCLEELPELNEYVKSLDSEAVKVIAFGLEDDVYQWKSETYNYPEFIHVVGLGKWENETGNAYNVSSTPTYFVLDSDKRIILKPTDFSDLKGKLSIQK